MRTVRLDFDESELHDPILLEIESGCLQIEKNQRPIELQWGKKGRGFSFIKRERLLLGCFFMHFPPACRYQVDDVNLVCLAIK